MQIVKYAKLNRDYYFWGTGAVSKRTFLCFSVSTWLLQHLPVSPCDRPRMWSKPLKKPKLWSIKVSLTCNTLKHNIQCKNIIHTSPTKTLINIITVMINLKLLKVWITDRILVYESTCLITFSSSSPFGLQRPLPDPGWWLVCMSDCVGDEERWLIKQPHSACHRLLPPELKDQGVSHFKNVLVLVRLV